MTAAAPLASTTFTPRYHWGRSLPFAVLHVLPLGALFFTPRWQDWAVCIFLYVARMFGITAGYHRYFAHRGFRAGRITQLGLAVLGTMAAQKGVLWWAGHHRHHHVHSDDDEDIHSPKRGFWWSHLGWILSDSYDATPSTIKDFARFPELRFLNKHWWLPPTLLGVAVFLVGGWSMLFTGFFLSTVFLWHGTFLVNSLAHVWGKRRFATTDTSRNNLFIALVTLGEGWHNNHHHFCSTANQGFYWWEIDISYYIIKALEQVGLVWGVRTPHKEALERNRIDRGAVDVAVPPKQQRAALQLPALPRPAAQLQDAE